MAVYDWNSGKLTHITNGDTLTCTKLMPGQLYALVLYNSAGRDASTDVLITTNNGEPKTITVPGTALDEGLASVVFLSGNDTSMVSAAVVFGDDSEDIACYIASVSMPTDCTDITNTELVADGQPHPFHRFNRFFAVPPSHWHQLQLNSAINQFICFQMQEYSAKVFVLNSKGNASGYIHLLGSVDDKIVVTQEVKSSTYSWSLLGNGRQFVFFNADSVQNSGDAKIKLQSLSGVFAAIDKANGK